MTPSRCVLLLLSALALGACVEDPTVLEPDPIGEPEPAPTPDVGLVPDRATPQTARFTVSPAQLDFTEAGESQTLTLTNAGPADLVVRGMQRDGSATFDVRLGEANALTLNPVANLAAGEAIELTVRAMSGAPATATLIIFTDHPQRPQVEVPLGFPEVPCLEADSVDMGEVAPGSIIGGVAEVYNCGQRPVSITALHIEGEAAFQLGVYALPIAVPAGQSRRVALTFNPQVEAPLRATLVLGTDAGLELRVPLVGRGRGPQCPVAQAALGEFVVVAGDVVQLDGSPSIDADGPDGRPVVYEWVVVRRPDGSISQPYESFYDPAQPDLGGLDDDLATPEVLLFVDRPGQYTVELRVRDDAGCEGRTEVQIVSRVSDEPGLVAVIDWDTRGLDDLEPGQGADLDLHLRHPAAEGWFRVPHDCYYRNVQPDWGAPGDPSDDCLLENDAIGDGPERLLLPILENTELLGGPYRLGVHFRGYRDFEGGGRQVATLFVRLGGEVVYETQMLFAAEDVMFEAIDIEWPSGEITPVERYGPGEP